MMTWELLIFTLPTENATVRMRVWRASKVAGVAVLRDGVYALPEHATSAPLLGELAVEIEAAGGLAYTSSLAASPTMESKLRQLVDRTKDYAELLEHMATVKQDLDKADTIVIRRSLRQLKRKLEALLLIDYFPGAPALGARSAYDQLAQAALNKVSPGEPRSREGQVAAKRRNAYRRRVWATRQHLWIDRLASAWLIRRFIDAKAEFVWLKHVSDLPESAVGFDFDGAEFTHIGTHVTFEVLVQSFALDGDAALLRLGDMVHFLDVGGLPVPEAPGFEALLRGLKQCCADDHALLDAGGRCLDALYVAFGGKGA